MISQFFNLMNKNFTSTQQKPIELWSNIDNLQIPKYPVKHKIGSKSLNKNFE